VDGVLKPRGAGAGVGARTAGVSGVVEAKVVPVKGDQEVGWEVGSKGTDDGLLRVPRILLPSIAEVRGQEVEHSGWRCSLLPEGHREDNRPEGVQHTTGMKPYVLISRRVEQKVSEAVVGRHDG
jgi:hypothetical protein